MSIGKVQIDIEEFLFETAEPCLDDKKGNEWLNRFRDTLQFKGRKANPLPFGIDCILEAEGFNAQQAVKRMSGVVKGELVKNGIDSPTTEQIEKALFERYGSEYITYKNAIRAKEQVLLRRERIKQRNIEESLGITADDPTREDGEFKSDSGYAANIYGDADTREGSDESATVSRNIGNDQGTEARQSMRTGGDSVRRVGVASPAVCHKSAGAPVRNSGRRFRNKEEFIQWAIDDGLDPNDAGECWDATLERGGKDAGGNRVNNMQAYAKQWCRTRAKNRSIA